MTGRALTVVGVADTDSYVKWTAALLGGTPPEWDVRMRVLETPLAVSTVQQRAAVAGSGLDDDVIRRVSLDELVASLQADPPDAVVVGARGPLTRVIARVVAGIEPRPVLITGLPGISIPATRKALVFRTQYDLFVVHSHREIAEFSSLAAVHGLDHSFALASLPFATRARSIAASARGDDLVFAAQAIVPLERADRLRVAAMLRAAAAADPARRVVLKLRASKGEQQTHAEDDPYPDLLAELGPVPSNLVTSTAPMRDALASAAGLVTVSSTAAVEAIAQGVPVIALDTFGIAPELINVVFEGSGLFGGEVDVVQRRFRHPEPLWLQANYFHDTADDDWARRLADLVALRRTGELAPRPPLRRVGGRLRESWERKLVLGPMDRTFAGSVAFVVGTPLRVVVRAARRVRRLLSEPAQA